MRLAKTIKPTEYFPIMTEFKAVGPEGIVEGYLNVKNVIDRGDDRTLDGCFHKSVAEAYQRKATQHLDGLWPYLWSHDYNTIPPGLIVDAEEDRKGLWIRTQLNLELQQGRDLFNSFKAKTLTSQSMGYKTHQYEYVKEGGRSIRNLIEVAIVEGSAVTFAMNTDSLVTAVKGLQRQDYNMLMRGKSFDSNYQASQLSDWQYSDWGSLSDALQQSILDLFAPGRSPLTDFEREVAPQLLAALRAYIQEGMNLGFSTAPTSAADVYLASWDGAFDESKAGYLTAQHHTTIKVESANIMKSAKAIAKVSDALEATRRNQLQGYPIARSTSSAVMSFLEEKEAEEAERSQIKRMAESLAISNGLREMRELTSESLAISGAVVAEANREKKRG